MAATWRRSLVRASAAPFSRKRTAHPSGTCSTSSTAASIRRPDTGRANTMTKRFLFRFALLIILSSASLLAFSRPSSLRDVAPNQGNGGQQDDQQHGDN